MMWVVDTIQAEKQDAPLFDGVQGFTYIGGRMEGRCLQWRNDRSLRVTAVGYGLTLPQLAMLLH